MAAPHILHPERLTSEGALLVPSRLNTGDFLRLIKHCSRRSLALLIEDPASYPQDLRQALQNTNLTTKLRSEPDTLEWAQQVVKQGALLIAVPPILTVRRATILHLPEEWLADVGSYGVTTQGLAIEYLREHCLSVEDTGATPETVWCFTDPVPAAQASPASLLEGLYAAAAEAYALRPGLQGHLGRFILYGLLKHGATSKIIDGLDGSTTTYHRIFAAAAALAAHIKRETKEPRVAIVLPPGRGALIANIAAVFAGKIPVNLNFSAGKEAVESAIRQSGIDRYITADVIVRKLQTFPWPALRSMIFIERELPRLKGNALRWLLAARFLPHPAIASLLSLPKEGGDAEAALLFTSGSSGEPKGVVLSHRNLIANVSQFGARLNLANPSSILGSLPLFHSFGCTVTLWYPAIEGIDLVTYPTPLEPPKLAELIEKHNIDVLLSTPTFLRGYLRRVKVEQLASLKYIVTGAEKLPLNVEEEFRKKFGKPVLEGYGLTETSPASNVNVHDAPSIGGRPSLPTRRIGSVGQLLPGLAIRISDPVTDAPIPIDQSGMIWLRGPNIFPGYLKQPRKSEEVLQDGWFRTGDIGRMDAAGFLYIEGRLSRFSKIGGEMVPHETIEEHIIRALNLDDSDRRIAVVGVPDPDKGEALVLLSTVAGPAIKQELIQLRYTLLDRGIPALWIPRRMVPVEHIPILASGKLDIKGCETIAAQFASQE